MSEGKTAHREFWLEKVETENDNYLACWDFRPPFEAEFASDKDNFIHVIEYSAVQELLDALEEIAKDFGTDYCDGNTMIAHGALTKFHEGKAR